MILTREAIFFILLSSGLILLDLLFRMLKKRTYTGFLHFCLLGLGLALFLMEILYLKLPLLDLLLAVAMGVLMGLHLLSRWSRRKK